MPMNWIKIDDDHERTAQPGDQFVDSSTFPSGFLGYTPVNTAGDTMTGPLVTTDLTVTGPRPWIDVRSYGAVADSVTDVTTNIQAAINAANAVGGGVVYIPGGFNDIYVVNGTLDLTDMENIHLLGDGSQNFPYVGLGTRGTILKRLSGTGTMLKWEASTAAQSIRGCKIEGIAFNGNVLAETVVSLKSIYMGLFRDLDVRNGTTACIALNTVDLAGTEDLQGCRFENISIRVGSGSGKGITLGSWRNSGTGYVGNTSFNIFSQVMMFVTDGTGLEVGDADTNLFENVLISRGGTAVGVDLLGSSWAGKGHARSNTFLSLSPGSGGVVSRATGYTQPAVLNSIRNFDTLNGASFPTIEPGSDLTVESLSS